MRSTVLVLASVTMAMLVCGVAWAGTFPVQNADNSGPGSLRAAINRANSNPGGDLITFAPNVRGSIILKNVLPELRGGLEIQGPGARGLTVRRSVVAEKFRVFTVAESANVTVSGLRLSRGHAIGEGGGIRNMGTLTLKGVDVSANRASGGGGGVYSQDGTLTVERGTFSGNIAPGGGGIFNSRSDTTITDSTFSGNRGTAGHGGGIANYGQLTVEGSTFSGNSAFGTGGGIGGCAAAARLTVRNSTFSGNTTQESPGGGIYGCRTMVIEANTITNNEAPQGGGIFFDFGFPERRAYLRMNIVAGNEALEGPDAYTAEGATFTSQGYNLIRDPSGAVGFGETDLTNTRAGLDPQGLQDNGGPTRTIALVADSPALDAVERGCPPPETDQRGVSRPQVGDGTARCDIGAFERSAP